MIGMAAGSIISVFSGFVQQPAFRPPAAASFPFDGGALPKVPEQVKNIPPAPGGGNVFCCVGLERDGSVLELLFLLAADGNGQAGCRHGEAQGQQAEGRSGIHRAAGHGAGLGQVAHSSGVVHDGHFVAVAGSDTAAVVQRRLVVDDVDIAAGGGGGGGVGPPDRCPSP